MPAYERRPFNPHGNGGKWSFKCLDCWYYMDKIGKLAAQTRALKHRNKRNHSLIIKDENGNPELVKCVILNESDVPPF